MEKNEDGTILPRQEQKNFLCGIGRLRTRRPTYIIGGQESSPQEFPFAVLLAYSLSKVQEFVFVKGLSNNKETRRADWRIASKNHMGRQEIDCRETLSSIMEKKFVDFYLNLNLFIY
jgi:hypothetical protein